MKELKAPKVCLISPLPPPYGGISHWTSLITKYARRTGLAEIEVLDIAPRWKAVHSQGKLLRIFGGGVQLIRDGMRLVMLLIFKRVSVVHLTTPGDLAVWRDVLFVLISKVFFKKFVYHIRFGRIPEIELRKTVEWSLISWVMRQADNVVVIDSGTFDTVRRYSDSINAVYIPNCVDFESLPIGGRDLNSQTPVAVYAGWIIPAKGVSELIESWTISHPKGWTLELIGAGDLLYQEKLKEKYPETSYKFFPQMSHSLLMERLSSCGLFILPSHSEGFPNVILEAMALSRPILATSVGAIPEMLSEGAGFLVESKNAAALARGISEMVDNEDVRTEMAGRAYDRAREFYSIEVVFAQYLLLWTKT